MKTLVILSFSIGIGIKKYLKEREYRQKIVKER